MAGAAGIIRERRRRGLRWLAAVTLLGPGVVSRAQELERPFCDDTLPGNFCPGESCACTDDVFRILFAGQPPGPVFEYPEFRAGLEVPALVMAQVRSARIRSYDIGVAHDPTVLELVDSRLSLDGTAGERAQGGGFVARRVVPGGFRVVIILNFTDGAAVLPLGENILVRATYTLTRDAGPAGTLLRFASVSLDVDGQARSPRRVADGVVRRRAIAPPTFRRGDCNVDGTVGPDSVLADVLFLLGFLFASGEAPPCLAACDANGDGVVDGSVSDAVYLLLFAFRRGPPPPAPFPGCGAGSQADALLGCATPPPGCG